MGESEGKSMLYLEARCLALVRAAGSQGVQNGSISCVALVLAVPGGTREVLAENVLAAWLDLEVASGNDAISSHSAIRKTAKLMGQFLPGTDFVTSGYSSMPRYDNMFGGGNYDSDDLDEWLTIQRDWQVDAGIEPLDEAGALAVRERAARAIQAVFDALRLPARHGGRGAPRDDVPRLARPAGPRPRRRRRRRRPRARRRAERPRRRARARRARLPRGRRGGLRHAAASRRRRLPSDLGDHRARRHRRLRRERRERLHAARAPATGSRASAGSACSGFPYAIDARLLGAAENVPSPVEELRRGGARRACGRGRDRGRARVRRGALGDDQRARARRRARRARGRRPRRGRRRRASSASRARPTSPSSATTARASPAPASRSASSRRARRSSIAPTSSRSTTSSSSGWRPR